MKKLIFLSLLALPFALACTPAEEPVEPAPAPSPPAATEEAAVAVATESSTAVAVLHNAEGQEIGIAKFTQADGYVTLVAEVKGVERPGPHGFHVHEIGECIPPFKSAGGHFNPKGTPHSCPENPERHAGDFGNIEIREVSSGEASRINQGNGMLDIQSNLVTVSPGETSIVGRAVILHHGTDDCAAQPTGDAGPRLACGVIHLQVPAAEAGDGDGAETDDGEKGKPRTLPRGDG